MVAAVVRDVSLTWDDLMPDQRKVLFALACGLSDPEIAIALNIPLLTVRRTISYIRMKLHLSDRVETILWALGHDAVAAEVLATI